MEKKSLMWLVVMCVMAAGVAQAAIPIETMQLQPYVEDFTTVGNSWVRNDHLGTLGTVFKVTRDVPVMKVGYVDYGNDGLAVARSIKIHEATMDPATLVFTPGALVAEVLVPAGTGSELAAGFRWVDLPTPVVLDATRGPTEYYILTTDTDWSDYWWESNTWWSDAGYNIAHFMDRNDYRRTWDYEGVYPAKGTWWGAEGGLYYVANLATLAGQLAGQTVAKGETAVFNAKANGSVTYTWKRDGVELVDGGKITGQGTDTLTVTDVQVVDEGDFSCVVSDGTYSDEVNAQLLTKRLVGWWKMDDLTDSVQEVEPDAPAHDGRRDDPNYVGSGYDGGAAMVFYGIGDPNEFMVMDDSVGYFDFEGRGITVNAWVKMPSTDVDPAVPWYAVVANRSYPGAGWGVFTQNRWSFNSVMHLREIWTTDGDADMFDDEWHMVTLVVDPTTGQMISYVDGTPAAVDTPEGAIRALAPSKHPLSIGCTFEVPRGSADPLYMWPMVGQVDDVRIWSYPLDAISISSLLPWVNFISQPQSQTRGPANGKAHAELSAPATSASGYQWYKDGGDRVADLADDTLLVDGGAYSGATTDTLIITDVTLAEEGGYFCVGLNSVMGDVASEIAYVEYARLKGQWTFEDNLNDVQDEVGGTYNGSWSSGDDGDAVYGEGINGSRALDLTNKADPNYLLIPVDVLPPSFAEATVALWSKNDILGQNTAFAAQGGEFYGRVLYAHVTWSDAAIYWDTGNPVDGWDNRISVGLLNYATEVQGVWNHYVFTCSPEDEYMAIYRNGTLISEYVGPLQSLYGMDSFVVGGDAAPDAEHFRYDGLIDDFRVYNYSVNAVEAAYLYTDVTGETVCIESVGQFDVTGPDGVPDCSVGLPDLAAFGSDWLACNQVPDCL